MSLKAPKLPLSKEVGLTKRAMNNIKNIMHFQMLLNNVKQEIDNIFKGISTTKNSCFGMGLDVLIRRKQQVAQLDRCLLSPPSIDVSTTKWQLKIILVSKQQSKQ